MRLWRFFLKRDQMQKLWIYLFPQHGICGWRSNYFNEEILLAKRAHDPCIGMFDLPGGFVDYGDAEGALKRDPWRDRHRSVWTRVYRVFSKYLLLWECHLFYIRCIFRMQNSEQWAAGIEHWNKRFDICKTGSYTFSTDCLWISQSCPALFQFHFIQVYLVFVQT